MTNYTAAARFGYLVVITIPLWDRHVPAEIRVEGTLWAVAAITLGSVVTALVERVFAQFAPGDDLVRSVAERLAAVERLLDNYARIARRTTAQWRALRALPCAEHRGCDATCGDPTTRRFTVNRWALCWR